MTSNSGNPRSRGNGLFLSDKRQSHGGASVQQIGVRKLPAISSRKIRERLIHLLALRSYTSSELFSTLRSEGLRKCEHAVVTIVLRDVGQLHHNIYKIRRHLWQEVDVNWPYYSDKEQQQVKWLKEQSLRPPNSSDENSTTSCSPESASDCSPSQKCDNNHIKEAHTFKRPNVNASQPEPSKRIRTGHTNNHNNTLTQSATNISSNPYNFNFSNYTEITSPAQRHHYKKAFEWYYREYMPLWQHIEELDRSFGELGGQILNLTVEQPDYVQIKKRIVEKYDQINSEEEIRHKQRCEYLEAKLAHIRQLVINYDKKCAEEAALAAEMARAKEYRLKQQPTPKPVEISNTKVEYADIVGMDLALSESDSDED